MRILILGGGGREHAIAWAVKQNPKCGEIIVAPGNSGIAELAICEEIDINDPKAVISLVKRRKVDFVIVGPEAPLVFGVIDALRSEEILSFGPTRAAAQLEASKSFTKDICKSAGIPTAAHKLFNEPEAAKKYIVTKGAPIVVKADGLAAGKGVVAATTLDTALSAVDKIFSQTFGKENKKIIIEEFLDGEEASYFALCDGLKVIPMGTAQDYKRVGDGNKGPNTGGMGAYSPANSLTEEVSKLTLQSIIKPTLKEMHTRGIPFHGILYAGLMIKNGQPNLIEFNVRFGDPECQVLMMRLGAQSLDLMIAAAKGTLDKIKINWANDYALTVVMANSGYPGQFEKGTIINNINKLPRNMQNMCFHAGTKRSGKDLVAIGGRVLNFTSRGSSLREAHNKAYKMARLIDWPEGFYRKDIGCPT